MANKSADYASGSASHGISLSSLRRKRGHIIGTITAFSKFVKSQRASESPDLELIKTHLEWLNDSWKRFDDIQFQLEELDDSESPRRQEIVNDYCLAKSQAMKLVAAAESAMTVEQQRAQSTSPSISNISNPPPVRLPEIKLPSFDGNIEAWASFFDVFSASIDRNENLTPVQKLQYLRSTLTGNAAACIAALPMTDSSYHAAIELLKKKFDSPRRVILKHCDAIHAYPRLSRDTPEALNHLVDTMNQHLRSLQNLNINVTEWSSLIIAIILSKISPETAWQWEITLTHKQMPSHNELLDFLETRANCASATIDKPSVPKNKPIQPEIQRRFSQRTSRPYAFVSTRPISPVEHSNKHSNDRVTVNPPKPLCRVCNEARHFAWECEQFYGLSLQARLATVEQTALCRNCLRPGHSHEECKRMQCRICRMNHHTLLHETKNTNSHKRKPMTKQFDESKLNSSE